MTEAEFQTLKEFQQLPVVSNSDQTGCEALLRTYDILRAVKNGVIVDGPFDSYLTADVSCQGFCTKATRACAP